MLRLIFGRYISQSGKIHDGLAVIVAFGFTDVVVAE